MHASSVAPSASTSAYRSTRTTAWPRRHGRSSVSRSWTLAWFPPDQHAAALRLWPSLDEDLADPIAYNRRLERHLANCISRLAGAPASRRWTSTNSSSGQATPASTPTPARRVASSPPSLPVAATPSPGLQAATTPVGAARDASTNAAAAQADRSRRRRVASRCGPMVAAESERWNRREAKLCVGRRDRFSACALPPMCR